MSYIIPIRRDVWTALSYYVNDHKHNCPVGAKITPTTAVNEILINFLAAQGHYPPKRQDPEPLGQTEPARPLNGSSETPSK